MKNSLTISLEEVKTKNITEYPTKWPLEFIQKCVRKLGQSVSGSKDTLTKRIINLKTDVPILEKNNPEEEKDFRVQNTPCRKRHSTGSRFLDGRL